MEKLECCPWFLTILYVQTAAHLSSFKGQVYLKPESKSISSENDLTPKMIPQ